MPRKIANLFMENRCLKSVELRSFSAHMCCLTCRMILGNRSLDKLQSEREREKERERENTGRKRDSFLFTFSVNREAGRRLRYSILYRYILLCNRRGERNYVHAQSIQLLVCLYP